jgi:phage major head subunit gpT-like protein
MALDKSKIIEILDPVAQKIKETVIDIEAKPDVDLTEYLNFQRNGRRLPLYEVAAVTSSQFPALLRDGIRPILFDTYSSTPTTWAEFCDQMQSDKPDETWLEGSHLGILPVVQEGTPYPHLTADLSRTVNIANKKYGAIIGVTREMIQFDRLNMIRQIVADVGPALAYTKEYTVYAQLQTAGNYTRTSADNEVGNNTAGTAFSATGLITAVDTLRTMTDKNSGRFLNVIPDTLICGPQLEWYARELLLAPNLTRASAYTTAEKFGTGNDNPFRGLINRIIVSPFVGTTKWVVMQAKKALMVQTVWGPELLQATATGDSFNYMNYDVLEYRADEMYGVGMLNDAFAYYSSGGTPAVT